MSTSPTDDVPDGQAPSFHGVYPAFVTKLVGAPRQGMVEVRFPTLGRDGDRDVRAWATLCSPYAAKDQGLEILPDVGTQVLVAFGAGQFHDPYILGACWNQKAPTPEAATEPNNLRLLRSRADSRLTFDDTPGRSKVTISMRSGHEVVLDDAAGEIKIRHATGPVITLTRAGAIEMRSSTVEVTAASVTVNSPCSTFNGIVNCTSLVASVGVASPLYSVGVGNLL